MQWPVMAAPWAVRCQDAAVRVPGRWGRLANARARWRSRSVVVTVPAHRLGTVSPARGRVSWRGGVGGYGAQQGVALGGAVLVGLDYWIRPPAAQ